ncbi:MAG: hypothetical protein P4L16_05450 [Chlamydiales bacterium]|nr:hypothetical protein [Chlamydiales bacterium]
MHSFTVEIPSNFSRPFEIEKRELELGLKDIITCADNVSGQNNLSWLERDLSCSWYIKPLIAPIQIAEDTTSRILKALQSQVDTCNDRKFQELFEQALEAQARIAVMDAMHAEGSLLEEERRAENHIIKRFSNRVREGKGEASAFFIHNQEIIIDTDILWNAHNKKIPLESLPELHQAGLKYLCQRPISINNRSYGLLANKSQTYLSFKDIPPLSTKLFKKITRAFTRVLTVNLTKCTWLTKEGFYSLASRSIISLDITGCSQIRSDWLPFFRERRDSLKKLNLSLDPSCEDFDPEFVSNLLLKIVELQLESLNITGRRLKDVDLVLLNKLEKLTELCLKDNSEISSEAFSHLHNLSLQKLDLTNCSKITDEVFGFLKPTLEEFLLGGCSITEHSFRKLVEFPLLNVLDLSHSEVTDDKIRSLVESLPNLKMLYLNDCPNITDELCERLAAERGVVVIHKLLA